MVNECLIEISECILECVNRNSYCTLITLVLPSLMSICMHAVLYFHTVSYDFLSTHTVHVLNLDPLSTLCSLAVHI